MFHEPERFRLWNLGSIEDYESTTGIFIMAESEQKAIAWAEQVADGLFIKINPNEAFTWKSMYDCWIIKEPSTSYWAHCLDSFPCIHENEMPDFESWVKSL